MKKIWVITLFPSYFEALKTCGVVGQALAGKRGEAPRLEVIQLRDFTSQSYKGVDDNSYGGGPGMVIRPDVLKSALVEGVGREGKYITSEKSDSEKKKTLKEKLHVVFTSPRGELWNNKLAKRFAFDYLGQQSSKDLVFICGRYEGIDQRFIDLYVDQEISLGNFVLSGGELAVMSIIDSAMRFIPEVLGNKESALDESFSGGHFEHPHYTRPQEFEGVMVPQVLTSGDHQKIKEWRQQHRRKINERD